jgi:hypothetical protein
VADDDSDTGGDETAQDQAEEDQPDLEFDSDDRDDRDPQTNEAGSSQTVVLESAPRAEEPADEPNSSHTPVPGDGHPEDAGQLNSSQIVDNEQSTVADAPDDGATDELNSSQFVEHEQTAEAPDDGATDELNSSQIVDREQGSEAPDADATDELNSSQITDHEQGGPGEPPGAEATDKLSSSQMQPPEEAAEHREVSGTVPTVSVARVTFDTVGTAASESIWSPATAISVPENVADPFSPTTHSFNPISFASHSDEPSEEEEFTDDKVDDLLRGVPADPPHAIARDSTFLTPPIEEPEEDVDEPSIFQTTAPPKPAVFTRQRCITTLDFEKVVREEGKSVADPRAERAIRAYQKTGHIPRSCCPPEVIRYLQREKVNAILQGDYDKARECDELAKAIAIAASKQAAEERRKKRIAEVE